MSRRADPTPAKRLAAPGWWLCAVRSEQALAEIAGEWDDLHARSSRATAFQSHAWLESWWRGYGRRHGLVLALVRRDRRLVAAAALARRPAGGVPVLVPVGAGISDYSDVLIDDTSPGADPDEAARRLARILARQARGGVIDLPEVGPHAAAWRMVAAWPGRTWRLPASLCLHLPARPIGELLAAMPRRSAKPKRRKLREIDAEGLQVGTVPSAQAPGAVAQLLRLHRLQWRGRGMNPEHGRARFAAHLARAATAMIERGEAALLEYRKHGVLVCVDLLVMDRRMLGGYLGGAHPQLRQRIDVNAMKLSRQLELAGRLGRPTLSMLRGAEEHKLRWHPRPERNERVLLAGAGAGIAPLYAAGAHARAGLAGTVRSHFPAARTALAWIRTWRASCT